MLLGVIINLGNTGNSFSSKVKDFDNIVSLYVAGASFTITEERLLNEFIALLIESANFIFPPSIKCR